MPPGPTGVPVSNLSYSDDRRPLRPTLPSLVELTRHCTRATVAKRGLVHMDKVRFFALQLIDSGLHQITSTVPYYLTPTSEATPTIVGIPLSHALKPPDAYANLAKQVTRMRRRIESLPTTTILVLRSLWAFILSQLDYIAFGVAIPPEHMEDLAIQLRAYYRHVLGLPCWTSRALLALPLSYGGPGCPHPPLRSACLLLLTYTQATSSRSLLAHRSARYLAETSLPGSEASPLRAAAQQLSVEVSLLPDPAISAMPVHSDTSPSVLHAYPSLILATDAALCHCDGGGGMVFFAPGRGIILRAWFGIRMWVTPAGAEWLAHLVGLYLLGEWSGHLTTAMDSTPTLLRAHTRFPPKLTILKLLWRRLAPTLLRLCSHVELWVQAHHDSHATHLLAVLNRESHQLAARGAARPTPWAVPLPHLLPAPLVLHYRGGLLVEPQLGLNAAYDVATATAYFSGRRAHLLRPDSTIFQAMLEADDAPTRAIKRALAYRVLELQPPPEPNISMECQSCGATEHQLWRHVRSRCPATFLHLRHAQSLLLRAAAPSPATTVTGDGVLLDGQGQPVLGCTWDSHYTSEAADMGDILTLSGLWYTTPDLGGAHPTAAARRRATEDVVSTLSQPALTLPDLLALWAALPFPLSTPAQPPPQPPAVSVLDHREAGSDPRGHLGVTWGVYLCAGKPPLADIILSHPPDLTRCDSVIGLAIPAMSGHIQYRGAAS